MPFLLRSPHDDNGTNGRGSRSLSGSRFAERVIRACSIACRSRKNPASKFAVARPRVMFINRSYWPDVEATGQLLTELCEDLAEDFDVTVICGQPGRSRCDARRRGATQQCTTV